MAQIVLAYAREDVAIAQSLKEHLERRGYSVFLDVGDRIVGRWKPYIQQRIQSANDLVVLVSKHTAESDEVPHEVQAAIDSGKNIVPVLLEEDFASTPEWLKILLAFDAARYDRLDLPVSTNRISEHLISRPSPFRAHNNRFWLGLVAALTVALGVYIWFGSQQSLNQELRRGSAIVYNGHEAYAKSGYQFATAQLVAWDSRSADLLVARPEGQTTAHLFMPYDAKYFKNPNLDSNARAGIQEVEGASLDKILRCPTDGYLYHWYKPKAGGLYCVRWRNGSGYSVIRIDTIDNDRIGFDYVVVQPSTDEPR